MSDVSDRTDTLPRTLELDRCSCQCRVARDVRSRHPLPTIRSRWVLTCGYALPPARRRASRRHLRVGNEGRAVATPAAGAPWRAGDHQLSRDARGMTAAEGPRCRTPGRRPLPHGGTPAANLTRCVPIVPRSRAAWPIHTDVTGPMKHEFGGGHAECSGFPYARSPLL